MTGAARAQILYLRCLPGMLQPPLSPLSKIQTLLLLHWYFSKPPPDIPDQVGGTSLEDQHLLHFKWPFTRLVGSYSYNRIISGEAERGP